MNNRHSPAKCGNILTEYVSRDGLTVRYDLLLEHDGGRSFYSVKVTADSNGETAYARDVTGSEDLAEQIFSLLHHGFVTPCCLFEVVEDLLESIPHNARP